MANLRSLFGLLFGIAALENFDLCLYHFYSFIQVDERKLKISLIIHIVFFVFKMTKYYHIAEIKLIFLAVSLWKQH